MHCFCHRLERSSGKLPFELKKKKKKLYGPLLLMGCNCLKARATSRRQFTFYHYLKIGRGDSSPWYNHRAFLLKRTSILLGSKAIRSNEGSPFVATFCKVVRNCYTAHSLMEMMQIVISRMKTRTDQLGDIKITVPSFSGSTCKKIYFGKYPGLFYIKLKSQSSLQGRLNEERHLLCIFT